MSNSHLKNRCGGLSMSVHIVLCIFNFIIVFKSKFYLHQAVDVVLHRAYFHKLVNDFNLLNPA